MFIKTPYSKLVKYCLSFFTAILFIINYAHAQNDCPKVDGLSATNIGDHSADLSWNSNDSHTEYTVDVMHGQGTSNFKWSTKTTEAQTSVDGLVPGSKYRYRTRAKCEKGSSGSTKWFEFTTTGEKPDDGKGGGKKDDEDKGGRCPKASNLAVIEVSDTCVTLTWLGNEENVSYLVDVHSKEHTPQFKLSETVNDTNVLRVCELEPGGNYKFRVKASCERNKAGSSSWINFVTTGGDTTFNQCPKPRNLSVLETSDTSALLSWVARDSALYFHLEVKSFEGTPSFHFDTMLVDTFYLIDDLEPEGNYHFRVRATCNDSTTSGSSDWSKFRTLEDTSENLTEETVETSAEAVVNTFPNPTQSELSVVLPLERLGATTYVVLSDLSGRVVYQNTYQEVPSEEMLNIPTEGLNTGIYKLLIRSIGFEETKTIVIEASP